MPPLAAAALIVFCEAMCFTTALPVISFFTQKLAGPENAAGWIGLMFAFMAGPKVLTNPIWGALSDRFGRRPILVLNTVGTLTASLGWAISTNVGMLALSRLLVGLFAGQAGLAQAIAADVCPPHRRAAGMGVLGAAFALAFAGGPLLGGYVAQHYSYAAVGWLCAALQATSLLVILLALPETRQGRVAADDARAGGEPESFPSATRILLGLILLFTVGLSVLNSTFGLMAEHTYGYNVWKTGQCFAVLGLIAAAVQGGAIRALVRKFSERRVMFAGMILLVWGFAMLASGPPLAYFWTAVVLVAIGSGLASTCQSALLSRSGAATRQGRIMGLQQGALGLGRALGGGLGGWLYARFAGPAVAYEVAAGIVALSLIAALLLIAPKPAALVTGDQPAHAD
jgi:MFS transporter, DHA1 family, tetracycline resistance protein